MCEATEVMKTSVRPETKEFEQKKITMAVDRTERIIENHDVRVGVCRSGQGDPRALSTTQINATFCDKEDILADGAFHSM